MHAYPLWIQTWSLNALENPVHILHSKPKNNDQTWKSSKTHRLKLDKPQLADLPFLHMHPERKLAYKKDEGLYYTRV